MRLCRICSKDDDFKVKSEEYINYSIQCGHDENHVRNIFKEFSNLTRQVARKSKDKRCDCCRNFLVTGDWFRSIATNKVFKIGKSHTCTLANVVYLAQCVECGLQGVGSSVNFKKRLANYKSHIKQKRRTCGILNHFLDCHDVDH